MDPLFYALIIAMSLTVLCEGALWWMFRTKISALIFPHELDTSYFRFASMRRLRIVAVVHVIVVSFCMGAFCLYLW